MTSINAGDNKPIRPKVLHKKITTLYQKLIDTYGSQNWWPADSAFETMLGAILTQNTNWSNVEKALAVLKHHHLIDPQALLDLPVVTLAKHIRSSGYYNQKAKRLQHFCAWFLKQGGYQKLKRMPTQKLRDALLNLHGIGPETADDIMLYAFKRPVFVIDAYTERLLQRMGYITGKWSYTELQQAFHNALPQNETLFGEYHALIVQHAKTNCRKKPVCESCTLKRLCQYDRQSKKNI